MARARGTAGAVRAPRLTNILTKAEGFGLGVAPEGGKVIGELF